MIDTIAESDAMQFVKSCFWKNKSRDFFTHSCVENEQSENRKLNVAVHIRRENAHDNGKAKFRTTTPNTYYLHAMNIIRQKYKGRDILFHIYSQGDLSQFRELEQNNVVFHLNEDIVNTFIGMVAAECLVLSPSALSYVAALLSDGEIYYKSLGNKPKKNWIMIKDKPLPVKRKLPMHFFDFSRL
jgi:hypothetical protein